MAALEMFKPLPLNYYIHHLGQPTRGKFATLCFSDSGETCAGMTEMLGGRIRTVEHLVPTWFAARIDRGVLEFQRTALRSAVVGGDCLSVSERTYWNRACAPPAGGGFVMNVLLVATNRERSPYPVRRWNPVRGRRRP